MDEREDRDVVAARRRRDGREADALLLEGRGERVVEVDVNAGEVEVADDLQGGRLAQVAEARLVGDADDEDARVLDAGDLGQGALDEAARALGDLVHRRGDDRHVTPSARSGSSR